MQGWFSNFSSYGQSDDSKPQASSPAVSSTSPKEASPKQPERSQDVTTSAELDDFTDLPANQLTAAMKRTTTLMRTSLDSLEAKLNDRIQEMEGRWTARLDKVERLTASQTVVSVDGSPGKSSTPGATSALSALSKGHTDDDRINNLKDDVQTVVDAIRLELLNVKRKLGMLDEMPQGTNAQWNSSSSQPWSLPLGNPAQQQQQQPPDRIASAIPPWSSASQSTRWQQELASKTDIDYVVQEMSTKFLKVQEDLERIKESQEQAGIKACYLALSAADLSREEKELMFERLKTNENRKNKGSPSKRDDTSDHGSGVHSLRSKAS